MSLQTRIRALETLGAGRVLALLAADLDLDLLPALHDTLCAFGRCERLLVLLHSHGGEANAMRRVALRLHAATNRLVLLAPQACGVAGTLLALAAHEIVVSPSTTFASIDRPLPVEGADGPSALPAQALRESWRDVRDAFDLDETAARTKALHLLADHLFPTTLTAFHRQAQELRRIADGLLSLPMADRTAERRAGIVQALLEGQGRVLAAAELHRLGLPVAEAPALDAEARACLLALERLAGPASNEHDDDGCDAVIATADGVQRRRRRRHAPAGLWEQVA